jgi:FkbM family methyltransferase
MALANPLEAPDFVHAATVETVSEGLRLLTFPDGFCCYSCSSVMETEFIYNEVMVKREYLRSGASIAQADCIVDVGANIGMFTLLVKSVNPDARVFAFEPIPENYEALRQNVTLHGLGGVKLFNVALGSTDRTERQFTFFPHMTGNCTARPELKDRQRQVFLELFGTDETNRLYASQLRVAPVRTLSSVMVQEQITNVDLLKIDVEGDEVDVLNGIDRQHQSMIRQIVAEVHHASLLPEYQAQLMAMGYQIYSDAGIASVAGSMQMYASRM